MLITLTVSIICYGIYIDCINSKSLPNNTISHNNYNFDIDDNNNFDIFTFIGLIIFNKNHYSVKTHQKNDLAKKREKANIARTFLLSSVDPCLLIAVLFDWISFWDNPDKKNPI
jgi:hypothetical protein